MLNIRKFRQSFFIKITILFVLALIFMITFEAGLRDVMLHRRHFSKIQRNVVNYCNYILEDIGTPPDTLLARQLAEEYGISLSITTPEWQWTNNPDINKEKELELIPYEPDTTISVGFHKGLYVDYQRPPYHFRFLMEGRREGFSYAAEIYAIILLSAFALLIFAIYLAMRWMLRPLRELHEGVHQISQGNLEVAVQNRWRDEFGDLIDSFNDMSRKIREMLLARERLLRDVSHELRSPLTRIKIALEFMEPSDTRAAIAEDVKEMETMISEILESERLNSPYGGLKKEKIDIKELLCHVSGEFQDKAPGVKLELPDQPAFALVDPDRFAIVLRNLLSNAFKFSTPQSAPVEMTLSRAGSGWRISVKDYGIGIPEEDLPFIFEPFYRVDKSRNKKSGGYGLGMSIVRQIVERHGGEIRLESTPEQGTEFIIDLPAEVQQ